MKNLFVGALLVALLLPALPGGARGTGSADGTLVAQNTTGNDSTTDTDPTTTLGRGSGNQDRLLFAGEGETIGLLVQLGAETLSAADIKVNAASARTDECTPVACADAAGALPVGPQAEAREPSDREDTTAAFDLDGEDEDLEAFLAGRLGDARATTSANPSARGSVTGAELDVRLTEEAIDGLSSALVRGLTDSLIRLDQALQDLPQTTASLDEIEGVVSELRDDLESHPLASVRGGDAVSETRFNNGVIRTESIVDTSTVTVLPTDQDSAEDPDGLFVIEIGPARSATAANGSVLPLTDADRATVTITILPGLLEALDADASTEVEDVIGQLPSGLVEILPRTLRSPTAAAAGLTLDRSSGGLTLDLSASTGATCLLDGRGLETCVSPSTLTETFDIRNRNDGVVVLNGAVDVDLVPEDTGYVVGLGFNRTEAGSSAAFQTTSTSSNSGSNSNTSTSQTGLPQTGSSSAPVLPALGLMILSGLVAFTLRRRRA